MNLPTFSTQGKSQDWIFYAVAGTLCLLYMVMYTFTADKEGYEEYERKILAAQQMLDSLKRLYL